MQLVSDSTYFENDTISYSLNGLLFVLQAMKDYVMKLHRSRAG